MGTERLVKQCLWSMEVNLMFLVLAVTSLFFSPPILQAWPREAAGTGLLACWLAFNILHKVFLAEARKAMGPPAVLELAIGIDTRGGQVGKKPLREVFEWYDTSLFEIDPAEYDIGSAQKGMLAEGFFEPAVVRELAISAGYGPAAALSRLLATLTVVGWVAANLYLGGML